MKLSDSCRFLTKIHKIPIFLVLASMMLILPMQVQAASCGGAISAFITPSEVLVPDLPEAVVVAIRAEVGGDSANLVTQALTVGMTCADDGGGSGTSVPCVEDDTDATTGLLTPIQFVSYITPPGGAPNPYESGDIPSCNVTGTTLTPGDVPNSCDDGSACTTNAECTGIGGGLCDTSALANAVRTVAMVAESNITLVLLIWVQMVQMTF